MRFDGTGDKRQFIVKCAATGRGGREEEVKLLADTVDLSDGLLVFRANGEVIAVFREWAYWREEGRIRFGP